MFREVFLKYIKKSFLIIPLTLLLYNLELFSKPSGLAVSDLMISKLFGSITYQDRTSYVLVFENLAFLIIGNILFSNYISNHFRYSSVYVFSRIKRRNRWFLKRAFEVILLSLIYCLMYIGILFLISLHSSSNPLDMYSVKITLHLFLYCSFIVAFTTLLINLLSIKYGSIIAIIAVQIFTIILTVLAVTFSQSKFGILNPMIVVSTFNLSTSVRVIVAIYDLLLIGIILYIGCKFIGNYDIALTDNEIS